MLCVFASCFSNWLCGGGLQHMCCQINENVYLCCCELSSLSHCTNQVWAYMLHRERNYQPNTDTCCVYWVLTLTAPATLTHISGSVTAEGRYSQQTEWKTYWQLTKVILQNAHSCNGALDDTPQSKIPSMASMIKKKTCSSVCACATDMTWHVQASLWKKKHSINGTEGICGN